MIFLLESTLSLPGYVMAQLLIICISMLQKLYCSLIGCSWSFILQVKFRDKAVIRINVERVEAQWVKFVRLVTCKPAFSGKKAFHAHKIEILGNN